MPCDKKQKENALNDTGGHMFEARDRTALALQHQCNLSKTSAKTCRKMYGSEVKGHQKACAFVPLDLSRSECIPRPLHHAPLTSSPLLVYPSAKGLMP